MTCLRKSPYDGIFKKVSKNLHLLFHICHQLDFRTSILFYNNFIRSYISYGAHLYYSLSSASATKPLFNLQKQAFRQVCNPFRKLNSHIKHLVIHGLHARPMFFPYHSSPLILPVPVHMLSKQGNAHLTLQVTVCHLLSRPHATKINYPALTTISLIVT